MLQKLTAGTLKGNWATLLLPIHPDDSINYDKLSAEISFLAKAGVDGIYSNNTAGEFYNLTENEYDKVQQLLSGICIDNNIRFQIGVSHPSPIVSLERVKRAVALKPDAFQVILPDWVSVTPQEQIAFLQRIAASAGDIPLVLYHPPHAKSIILAQHFQTLKAAVPALIGVKLASGDAQWFANMRKYRPDLAIFVPGHLLATGIKERVASGAYSNVACLNPVGAQWWRQLMQVNLEKALEIESRISQFFDECIIPFKSAGYSNPAQDKFLAAIGGWAEIGTRLRWPYQSIDQTEVEKAQSVYRKLLPEFNDNYNLMTH